MSEGKNASPMGLYATALGEKNSAYYVNKFHKFDQKGPGLKVSWNWAAFFFGGIWALYRKMYGWFFAWWFVATVLTVFKTVPNAAIQIVLPVVVLACWLGFAVFANSVYHSKIKARIAAANRANSDASMVIGRLHTKGGIHSWVPIVFGAIPVIGIVAAVALPAFHGKSKEQVALAHPEATSTTPALAEADPELPTTSQPQPVDAGAANKQAQANRLTPEQVARNEWNRAENAAMNSFKNEGYDYLAKPTLFAAYNTHLKALGNDPKNERRDAPWFLNEAHRLTKEDLGMATKKPTPEFMRAQGETLNFAVSDATIAESSKREKPVEPTGVIRNTGDRAMATKPKLGISGNNFGAVPTDANPDDYVGTSYSQPAAPAIPAPEQGPPITTKKELGPIDRWRYQSCQQGASQAPTQQGVTVGLRICREKFAQ